MIPIDAVSGCNYVHDSNGSVLMLTSCDPATNQPRMHFFQSSTIPVMTRHLLKTYLMMSVYYLYLQAETINNEIQIAIATRKRQRQQESRWVRKSVHFESLYNMYI